MIISNLKKIYRKIIRYIILFYKYFFSNENSYCPICNMKKLGFNPLPKNYIKKLVDAKYQYLGKGEMTNYVSYTCSYCGASDRERLYALWLDKYFLEFFKKELSDLYEFEYIYIAESHNNKIFYRPLSQRNIARRDDLGEFLNLPLMIMRFINSHRKTIFKES